MNPILLAAGNRPLSLADHLERLAHDLETGAVDYDWTYRERCNCGLLARSITGLTEGALEKALPLPPTRAEREAGANADWRAMASKHCEMTGRPMHEIFAKLYDAGMRFEDYAQFERLTNPEVMAEVSKRFTRNVITDVTRTKVYLRLFKYTTVRQEPTKVPVKQLEYRQGNEVAIYCREWAKLIRAWHAGQAAATAERGAAEDATRAALAAPSADVTPAELRAVDQALAKLP
jgi:hypothetical protein